MAVWVVLVGLNKVPETTAALVALIPPVRPPDEAGIDQLYNVPAGTMPLMLLAGESENELPLQIVAVTGIITAEGLMVTETVNPEPVQAPDTGVTI